MLGISHLRLPVSRLEVSRRFYESVMGFQVLGPEEAELSAGPEGAGAVLDALGVRLCLSASEEAFGLLELSFQTARVRAAVKRLSEGGAVVDQGPTKTSRGTLEAVLRDPDGHRLRIWRKLREDELEQEPELPTTRAWEEGARTLLRAFLQQTPVLFRDLARKNCVREAEHLTPDGQPVGPRTVARAVVRATPRLMRSRLRRPLGELGFDPDDFSEDFSV